MKPFVVSPQRSEQDMHGPLSLAVAIEHAEQHERRRTTAGQLCSSQPRLNGRANLHQSGSYSLD